MPSVTLRRFLMAPSRGWVLGVWGLAWSVMLLFDDRIDLANKALLLVLASAVSALWSSPAVAVSACAAAVLAFNVAFVPPRGLLSVNVREHVLLLVTMLVVSWAVSLLMSRQRRMVASERLLTAQAEQLRQFGDALREVDDPRDGARRLQAALAGWTGLPVALWLRSSVAGDAAPPGDGGLLIGSADATEFAAMKASMSGQWPVDPPVAVSSAGWLLPMRGRGAVFGVARLRLPEAMPDAARVRGHVQALCDQMGLALERSQALQAAQRAHEAAQSQALRNTLLAAISHDHRTPLATILGAASALHDQDDRLSAPQRRRLARTIVDEASQLARLTENTLQLARLDAPGTTLHADWESVEEIVGTVMRRLRQRDPAHPVRARVEAGLPLIRCDAVLLVQLLDNLVDNALRHGGAGAPVEIAAARDGARLVVSVSDRGPGVPEAMRERIFDTFHRGAPAPGSPFDDTPARRGAGVGLAVCRAIARVHGGELHHRPREGGGSVFVLSLPALAPPAGLAAPDGVEAA